jgi:hypothetical protein
MSKALSHQHPSFYSKGQSGKSRAYGKLHFHLAWSEGRGDSDSAPDLCVVKRKLNMGFVKMSMNTEAPRNENQEK